MSSNFDTVFMQLRTILERNAGNFSIRPDKPGEYGLAGGVGPAALTAWGGRLKKPIMPIAWVIIGKSYVSYHLMGLYGNKNLLTSISKKLKARMQGKTCFNFKSTDEELFRELEELTIRSITAFRKMGYVI